MILNKKRKVFLFLFLINCFSCQIHANGPELLRAVKHGDLQLVKELVKNSADINYQAASTGRKKETPLNLAIASYNVKKLKIAKFLIKSGAKVNIKGWLGNTPLHYALQYHNVKIMQLLLKHGADPFIPNDMGQIVIKEAASRAIYFRIIKDSFASGNENTTATSSNSMIIDTGNTYENYENIDETLKFAVNNGFADIVKLCLEKGANANVEDFSSKDTPLIITTRNGNPKIAKLLIKYNADLNHQDSEGFTALMLAARSGNTKMVKLLLKNRAKSDIKCSRYGSDALNYAAQYGHTKIIKKLLENGDNINTRSNAALDTPLLLAASWGKLEACELLLSCGADPNLKDRNGDSALNYAIMHGYYNIAILLIENGANIIDVSVENSMKLLTLAIDKGNISIVRTLLENGIPPKNVNINKVKNVSLKSLITSYEKIFIQKLPLQHQSLQEVVEKIATILNSKSTKPQEYNQNLQLINLLAKRVSDKARELLQDPSASEIDLDSLIGDIFHQLKDFSFVINQERKTFTNLVNEYLLQEEIKDIKAATSSNSNLNENNKICPLCLKDIDSENSFRLQCNHIACSTCLENMLDMALNLKDSNILQCAKCNYNISENEIRQIISNDRQKLDSYYDVTTLGWLNKNKAKYCPTPDCSFVFTNEENSVENIICPQCNKEFCPKCLLSHPNNLTCLESARLDPDDFKNVVWIKENTKPCPKCRTRIEKGEYCDVTCDYVKCIKCTTEFCYNCYGSHHVYNCSEPPVNLDDLQELETNSQEQALSHNIGLPPQPEQVYPGPQPRRPPHPANHPKACMLQ